MEGLATDGALSERGRVYPWYRPCSMARYVCGGTFLCEDFSEDHADGDVQDEGVLRGTDAEEVGQERHFLLGY